MCVWPKWRDCSFDPLRPEVRLVVVNASKCWILQTSKWPKRAQQAFEPSEHCSFGLEEGDQFPKWRHISTYSHALKLAVLVGGRKTCWKTCFTLWVLVVRICLGKRWMANSQPVPPGGPHVLYSSGTAPKNEELSCWPIFPGHLFWVFGYSLKCV